MLLDGARRHDFHAAGYLGEWETRFSCFFMFFYNNFHVFLINLRSFCGLQTTTKGIIISIMDHRSSLLAGIYNILYIYIYIYIYIRARVLFGQKWCPGAFLSDILIHIWIIRIHQKIIRNSSKIIRNSSKMEARGAGATKVVPGNIPKFRIGPKGPKAFRVSARVVPPGGPRGGRRQLYGRHLCF